MIDVSVLMPAIRVPNWKRMYDSITLSCQKYSFELVLVSPFDLPDSMKDLPNVKLIKDFGHPTRAAQIGLLHCEGRLLYHCVDDALFYTSAIDNAVEMHDKHLSGKDVVNMRYREGSNFSGQEFPPAFWWAHYHGELAALPGINKEWKMSMHPLMRTGYLKSLGGWDCSFEYINHPLHDLMFRVQADGGRLYDSPTTATSCDHHGGRTVDHAAIHDAQTLSDKPKFDKMYALPGTARSRIKIPLNNWESTPDYWQRRFKGTRPTNYEEILALNND